MGIFSRLADIVNANLSAILDRAEDPAKIIRLMIQEMEETLVEVRADAARLMADRKEIQRKLGEFHAGIAEWEKRAEVAVQRGREDLAKAALVEKAKVTETSVALERELQVVAEQLAQADADIARLQDKLTEAKSRQQTIETRVSTADTRLRVRRTLYDSRVDDALARFDQMQRKVEEAEGRVDVYDLGQRKSLADEIAELEAEARIEQEMARLKSRVGAAPGGTDSSAAG